MKNCVLTSRTTLRCTLD